MVRPVNYKLITSSSLGLYVEILQFAYVVFRGGKNGNGDEESLYYLSQLLVTADSGLRAI